MLKVYEVIETFRRRTILEAESIDDAAQKAGNTLMFHQPGLEKFGAPVVTELVPKEN